MTGDLIGSLDWAGSEIQCVYYSLMLKSSEGLTDARPDMPVTTKLAAQDDRRCTNRSNRQTQMSLS